MDDKELRLKREILELGLLDKEIKKVALQASRETKYLFVLQYLILLKEEWQKEIEAISKEISKKLKGG